MPTQNTDNLTVELEIKDGNAEVVIGKAKQKLQDFVKDAEKLQPQISLKIPNDNYINLDKLEKRAEETRRKFSEIGSVRLDNGSIGSFTREIVTATQRANQLQSDLISLRREILNPKRKTSIGFLTDEIRGAEMELASLNRKLATVGSNASVGTPTAANLKLTSFQKQNLSYQINDVATMAAMGANPTQILASQGGQIAQIFNPAQITAFTAAYSGLVTILGAGAAAIALTYKITSDIRAESERRLKVENSINAAINTQLLSQMEVIKNFKKMRESAIESRQFDRYLSASSLDELITRRANLEKLNKLIPATLPVIENGKVVSKPNENYEKNTQQLLALDAQIEASRQQKLKSADDSFNKRGEDYIKSQQKIREIEEQRAKEFAQSVEKGKDKVKELGKTYEETLSNVFLRSNTNNPFVSLFSEADKSLKTLRENTLGLSKDLIATFTEMETKANSLKLFESRLNNNLDIFDLRESANSFRNPFDAEAEKKQREEIARRAAQNGGSFGGDLALRNGGFDKLSDTQKRDIYEVAMFRGLANSSANSDLNQRSLATALANDRFRGEDKNLSINQRLEKQLAIIYGNASSGEEKAIADRKLIALTNGLDPNSLSRQVREAAALSRENEAARRENSEKDAKTARDNQLKISEQIRDELKKLNEVAGKDGFQGVIRIINEAEESAKVSARPNDNSTRRLMQN